MSVFELLTGKREEDVEIPREIPIEEPMEPQIQPGISPRDELEIAIRQLKELRGTV